MGGDVHSGVAGGEVVTGFWLAAALGGLGGMEGVGGPLMLGRPLVLGSLVGWALGHPLIGFEGGALAEILWRKESAVPPRIGFDSGLVGAVAAGAASGLPDRPGALLLGLLWAVPWGALGRRAEQWQRLWHVRALAAVESRLHQGEMPSLRGWELLAVAASWTRAAGLAAAGIALGAWVVGGLQPRCPLVLRMALGRAEDLLPLAIIGAAIGSALRQHEAGIRA